MAIRLNVIGCDPVPLSVDGDEDVSLKADGTAYEYGGGDTILDIYLGKATEWSNGEIEEVPNCMFYNANKLTKVSTPNARKIGFYAFEYCSSLKELSSPNVEYISSVAFMHCSDLTSVTLPSATFIGGSVFQSCANLRYIDLPAIETIGDQAFQNCSNLYTLIVRTDHVPTMTRESALYYTPIYYKTGYIYVPRDLISQYEVAKSWKIAKGRYRALEDYTVDGTITGDLDESKI